MGKAQGLNSKIPEITIARGKDKKGEDGDDGLGSEGHPADRASWWSFATFSWMSGLMYSSYKTPLQASSIPFISSRDSCRRNTDVLEDMWEKELGREDPRLGRVLWRFVRRSVLASTFALVSAVVLGFFSASVMLKRVLDYSSDSSASLLDGILRVTLLIMFEFSRVFVFTLFWALSYRTAIRLQTACQGLVYRKILRLANQSDHNVGKIFNAISTDCQRIYDILVFTQVAIGGPIILTLGACYIFYQLGLLPLLGMLVFPASYPIQYILARLSASFKRKSLIFRDSRVMYLTQSLQNLTFIKMFAWETYFGDLITQFRKSEKRSLFQSQFMHSCSVVLSPILPHIGAIITFILYINAGYELTPAQAFSIIALYNGRIRPTLNTVRLGFRAYLEGLIAIQRVQALLVLPEVQRQNLNGLEEDEVIIFENVAVSRRTSVKDLKKKRKGRRVDQNQNLRLLGSPDFISFKLENITVTVKKGSFIGICGHVGSGKSTFLETIVGSLNTEEGTTSVLRSIAFVPQEPWILKDTLRNNILFGESFEQDRFDQVVKSCCLTSDFQKFPQADQSEARDRGSNLSGGQRQRIGLARALYHFPHRQVYLLDDPFSGLDVRVANTIYEKVVLEQLQPAKTVLLATHHLNFLRDCDEILVFSHGHIVERGTHAELLLDENSHYKSLMAASMNPADDHEYSSLEGSEITCDEEPDPVEEKRDFKSVIVKTIQSSWQAYRMYVGEAGGIFALVLILLIFGTNIASIAFSSWWLKNWFQSSASLNNNTNAYSEIEVYVIDSQSPDFEFQRNIYAAIIGVIFLTSFLRTSCFVFITLRAAQKIHKKLVDTFFHSRLHSISEFGTGHILNLLTKDISEVDIGLPHSLEFLLQNVFMILSILFMVSIVFPYFLAPLFVLFGIFLLVRRVYNAAIKEMKRLESEAATPVFTIVNETVSGIGIIRGFGKEQQMIHRFEKLVDWNSSLHYTFVSAIRWLAFRLDSLSVSVTAITAIFILIFRDVVSPASCGLALSYAAQLSGIFQFTVRVAADVEAKFVCVERINSFLGTSEREEVKRGKNERSTLAAAPPNWPTTGHVKFESITLAYSQEPPIIKNVSFEIKSGCKIGIVGRTGSGKSSIGTALYRLVELRSGCIYVDGVDISKIPLCKLRSTLCIIPQDAAIFSKSIRFNLDPGNENTDSDLWTALDKCGLKSLIESLDAEVALSHGQKQLLSIARAILRPSPLVFVDEATSSVDMETSAVLDRLIIDEFRSSTVMIVTHRLQTLKYCDYLLIMDDGEVQDFGPTEVLRSSPKFLNYFQADP